MVEFLFAMPERACPHQYRFQRKLFSSACNFKRRVYGDGSKQCCVTVEGCRDNREGYKVTYTVSSSF
jgi:hypothetical protein